MSEEEWKWEEDEDDDDYEDEEQQKIPRLLIPDWEENIMGKKKGKKGKGN